MPQFTQSPAVLLEMYYMLEIIRNIENIAFSHANYVLPVAQDTTFAIHIIMCQFILQ